MNPELFENTFYAWLEANGVTFDEPIGEPPFRCTIDLNALKVGVGQMIGETLDKFGPEETTGPMLQFVTITESHELPDDEAVVVEATWD